MQQHQIFWHNILYLIGDKYLTGVQLNFIALNFKFIFKLRKIKNTCQVKRIVYIKMNPKQRLFCGIWIKLPIERQVILIFKVCRSFGPRRIGVVDNIINLYSSIFRFTVFVLTILLGCGFGAEANLYRKEF